MAENKQATAAPHAPTAVPTDPTMQRVADALEHIMDHYITGGAPRKGPQHADSCPFCGSKLSTRMGESGV